MAHEVVVTGNDDGDGGVVAAVCAPLWYIVNARQKLHSGIIPKSETYKLWVV